MPQAFRSAVMTDAGAELLTKAQAGQVKIEFTRLAVGDGIYTQDEKSIDSLKIRTGLKSARYSYTFSDVDPFSKYSVKLTALITNQDPVTKETIVTEGFYINEMGLYAKPEGGSPSEEVLYSIVVTAAEGNGDFMPAYNGSNLAQISQDYFVTVSNSAEVTIDTKGAALLVEDAYILRDDTTNKKYRLGVNNGLLYVKEVDE